MNIDSEENTKSSLFKYRPDIDGMRALAVIAVILYHISDKIIPAGFAGVDIFFVISGYVVTATIFKRGFSSFREYILAFYSRRVKRILPNLILVILFFSVLAFFLIPSNQLRSIIETGMYGLIGFSNVYLAFESFDYFGIGTEANLFLHTWSLGVEEQFYIVYPVILWLVYYLIDSSDKLRIIIFTSILLISMLISTILLYVEPVYAFYFMPSRFWELLAGGGVFILQLSAHTKKELFNKRANSILSFIGLILVIYGLFFSSVAKGFPIPTGIPIVIGSLLMIGSGTYTVTPISRILSSKILVYIGLLSYSLYLWHWPIIVFFKWTIGLQSANTITLAIVMTVLLAWLSYEYVEYPFRKIAIYGNGVKIISVSFVLIVTTLIVIKYGYKTIVYFSKDGYNPVIYQNLDIPTNDWGKDIKKCHFRYYNEKEKDAIIRCLKREENKKQIYMLGDSHVQALYFMVYRAMQNSAYNVVQMHNNEIPLILQGSDSNPPSFNYVIDNAKQGDLLIISFFRGKFYNNLYHVPLDKDPMKQDYVKKKYDNLYKFISRLSVTLNKKGVNILLINDVPQMKNPVRIHQCVIQNSWSIPNACDVSREQSLHTRKPMTELIESLSNRKVNVFGWDPHDAVCPDDKCQFHDNRGYIMIDHNHISRRMSEEMSIEFYHFLKKNRLVDGAK